jgi:hypothetical protein
MDWTHHLADQLEFHWDHQLRPRLEGMSDREYLWEPVEGCWSLRSRHEATTPMAVGRGDVVVDFEVPDPDPAPVTTIAWRMAHLSVGVFGTRAADHFGGEPITYQDASWSLSAAEGLALLDRMYSAWMEGVKGMGPDDLAAPCGPAEGPWADAPMATLVLHIHREAIHHGAEISLLRDLYLRMG